MKAGAKGIVIPIWCLGVLILAGCSIAGPRSISSGRLSYNEAIAATSSQQMLMSLVRQRYAHSTNLLAVSSITANVRISTGTSLEFGFGTRDNYDGNLVPLTAKAMYEENPTISYAPVAGEKYLSRVASPVDLATLARLAGTLVNPEQIYRILVSSINGIHNPDFLHAGVDPDPRFDRLVSIIGELSRAYRLHWLEDPTHGGQFSIVLTDYEQTYSTELGELFQLAGLASVEPLDGKLILPVSLAIDGRAAGGLGISTRSVLRLAEVMTAAIELPPADATSGVTIEYPPIAGIGAQLNVHYDDTRPDNAAVAVAYRNGWFFISDDDPVTKGYFRILSTLWSISIAESTGGATAPVLTVPVSR